MAILTRSSAAALLNTTLSSSAYPDTYLNGVIAAIEGSMAAYLGWNPVLTYWQNETGVAQYVQGGTYAGRYFLELHNQPLVPGAASAIFTKLQLTYPLALPVGADVALDYVKVLADTGQVFCLAPGSPEALAGFMFGTAPTMQRVTAVSYIASYCSGYATGNSDPNNPITHAPFSGVPALPAVFTDAALLLLRERLAYDAAMNANTSNPNAGQLYRVRVGEREEEYRSFGSRSTQTQQSSLGLGTPLAVSAAAKLARYVKRTAPMFV